MSKAAASTKAFEDTYFTLSAPTAEGFFVAREKGSTDGKNLLAVGYIDKDGIKTPFNKSYTAFVQAQPELWQAMLSDFKRTGKGEYTLNPLMAGILYHFIQRIRLAEKNGTNSTNDMKNLTSWTRENKSLNEAITSDNLDISYMECINPENGKISLQNKA